MLRRSREAITPHFPARDHRNAVRRTPESIRHAPRRRRRDRSGCRPYQRNVRLAEPRVAASYAPRVVKVRGLFRSGRPPRLEPSGGDVSRGRPGARSGAARICHRARKNRRGVSSVPLTRNPTRCEAGPVWQLRRLRRRRFRRMALRVFAATPPAGLNAREQRIAPGSSLRLVESALRATTPKWEVPL